MELDCVDEEATHVVIFVALDELALKDFELKLLKLFVDLVCGYQDLIHEYFKLLTFSGCGAYLFTWHSFGLFQYFQELLLSALEN